MACHCVRDRDSLKCCVLFTAQELAARGEKVVSKLYESLESQVWSMLKGFCTRPTDLAKVGIPQVFGVVHVLSLLNSIYSNLPNEYTSLF